MPDGIKVRPVGSRGQGQGGLLEQQMHVTRKHGSGVIAYTHEIEESVPTTAFAVNSDFGRELAQNGLFTGSPEEVHDGIDSVFWTASAITGSKFTFDSTDRANSGTKSVKTDNAATSDTMEFDKGSDVVLSGFTAITIKINVDKNWAAGDIIEIYGYDTGSAIEVGNRVSLGDYFDFTTFDIWQSIAIPLDDMGLSASTIDALRIQVVARSGASPTYYLDDIQIEQSGLPIVFKMQAVKGKILNLHGVDIVFIDAYNGRLADSSMPNLSYNQILAVTQLTNGLLTQVTVAGEIISSFVLTNLGDFLSAGFIITDVASDGTNTILKLRLEFRNELILPSIDGSNLSLTVADDLTGLISFTARGFGFLTDENPE